jgi:hypothetical protein
MVAAPRRRQRLATARQQQRKGKAKKPEVFSKEGGLWHAPVPPQLQGLSYAEEAVISRVQPIVAVQVLARGARAMRGTCCFVERVDDVGELAEAEAKAPYRR